MYVPVGVPSYKPGGCASGWVRVRLEKLKENVNNRSKKVYDGKRGGEKWFLLTKDFFLLILHQ